MKLDLKQQRESFIQLDFEGKRQVVVTILEGIRDSDFLFEQIYRLITSDRAIEQDFYDVFDSLMIVLYREAQSSEKEALINIENMRSRLIEQQKEELSARMREMKDSEDSFALVV